MDETMNETMDDGEFDANIEFVDPIYEYDVNPNFLRGNFDKCFSNCMD